MGRLCIILTPTPSNKQMKKIFTIIGNCQSLGIAQLLRSNKVFENSYEYVFIKSIHEFEIEELEELYKKIIPKLDLVIIQPIDRNYKNHVKYSTFEILSSVNIRCKKILFPSLYFSLYQPNLQYIYHEKIQSGILHIPSDYHDNCLIKIFIDKEDDKLRNYVDKYEYLINSETYFGEKLLMDLLESNICELKKRESFYHKYIPKNIECSIINSSEIISRFYNKQLLFYSVNHPTKFLLKLICNEILKILKIDEENYPDNLDPLYVNVIPIFKSLNQILDFDVEKYYKLMLNNKELSLEELVKAYIDVYREIDKQVLIDCVTR